MVNLIINHHYSMIVIINGEWWLIIIWLVVDLRLTYPSENHGIKVSWDDDIPNWMEK